MTDTAGRNQPTMPPGRELDADAFNAEVAENVMGWKSWKRRADGWWWQDVDGLRHRLPDFQRSWDAMRLVVERLVALDHVVQLTVGATDEAVVYLPPGRTLDGACFSLASGDTLPHAVCLAALAALKAVEADRA